MTRKYRSTAGTFLISAVLLVGGCETGGAALPDDSPFYVPELYCPDTSMDSPTDYPCHEDCERPCGFNPEPKPRATKYCVCEGGVFIECRCPRPDWYKGAPSAPYCDDLTPDGKGETGILDEEPCPREWDQCVGRDLVDGFTPRGCACLMKNSGNGLRLEWDCGSTEKWFYPDQSTIP
jgi:hypothetical protein